MAEDSVSFLPHLLNPKLASASRPPIIHDSRTIRDGDWKLILPKQGKKNSSPTAELYDLTKDLSEQNNLYRLKPEVARRLESQLKSFLSQVK